MRIQPRKVSDPVTEYVVGEAVDLARALDEALYRKAHPRPYGVRLTASRASERYMEDKFVDHLASQGRRYRRQVRCEYGIADVVDDEYVYELKTGNSQVFHAIGQVVLYAKALRKKPAVVLGREPSASLAKAIRKSRIRLEVFPC
jgi:hypothetical protein